jgi:uncharacterized protein (DUF58 family)
MSTRPETREKVKEILHRVSEEEIQVPWSSRERMPGSGNRNSVFRGSGTDFDGHEDYEPGEDDLRDIDWIATALTGGQKVLVARFREERNIRIYLIGDINRSMDFGTTRVSKRELAAELAAYVLVSAEETKDQVGMMLFSAAGREKVLPPASASLMQEEVLEAMLAATPADSGPGNGLAGALAALPSVPSLVCIFSDFLNLTEADWASLASCARRHDILCFYVQDKRERELPQLGREGGLLGRILGCLGGRISIQDPTGTTVSISISAKSRARYAANFEKLQAGIIARLQDARCRHLVVSTEEGEAARPQIRQALAGR